MWGVALAMLLSEIMWWTQLHRGLHDHRVSVETPQLAVVVGS